MLGGLFVCDRPSSPIRESTTIRLTQESANQASQFKGEQSKENMMVKPMAAVLVSLLMSSLASSTPQPADSPNKAQVEELGTLASPRAAEANVPAAPGKSAARRVRPAVDPNEWIVMGYVQSDVPASQYHWHALTHIVTPFVDFESNGTLESTSPWVNRDSEFQPGGAADRNGVKVLYALRNDNFSLSTLDSVMRNATYRATLVSQAVALIDENCAGINLDFEPTWNSTTRTGVTAFLQELRAAMDVREQQLGRELSLSMYVGPTYVSSRDDPGAWAQYLDFMNFSCYPWAGSWSSSVTSVAPQSSYTGQVDNFLERGVPLEKMVLTMPSYGVRYRTNSAQFGASITSYIGSMGFARGKFNTTLSNPSYTREYRTGNESVWYAIPDGGSYQVHTYDDEESLGIKMHEARHWSDYGGRLGGVSYWSLMWMSANPLGGYDSYDLETNSSAFKLRTYPHIYQQIQEIFASPGQTEFFLDKWESLDPRWRNPSSWPENKDHVGVSFASRSVSPIPELAGAPGNSAYGMALSAGFDASGNSRMFFRYELLGHHFQPSVVDQLATRGFFDATTKILVDVHAASFPGRTIRLVVMDGDGELEMSPAVELGESGWRTLEFDLTAGGFAAYSTNFNQYTSGDGVLDTAGAGQRDLAVIGFLLEGNGQSGVVNVVLDELRYAHTNPGGVEYVINEFRYRDEARQFVEIHGPAGPMPDGMVLRGVSGSNGQAVSTIALGGQSIPNDGDGYGFFVVGRSALDNVDLIQSTAFLESGDASAIQLANDQQGLVYDSVVYRAFGGLGALDGARDPRVTENGYPYLGDVGPGLDTSGDPYTKGRYPDGANAHVNYDDFSFMPATPGAPNGGLFEPRAGQVLSFDSVPNGAFASYQEFFVEQSPVGSNGTMVHRCVDPVGGGIVTAIGDAALGADGEGYRARGRIYIPTSAEPAQAIAVGICGSQGSTFFTNFPDSSGYETGYWLIYENASGIGLNNGRPDHPGTFEFVHATHDNYVDDEPVAFLGSATRASTGAPEGDWVNFEMFIDPAEDLLVAQINGSDIYRGPIPTGGPISGAFQMGYRENHTGAPTATEGTWIDDVEIASFGSTVVAGDVSGDGQLTPADAHAVFECYMAGDCAGLVNPDEADFCPAMGSITPADAQGLFNAYLGISPACQ